MKKLINNRWKNWINPIFVTLITSISVGLISGVRSVRAADIVCTGTMLSNINFTAYHGENGFGRIKLEFPKGGIVEIPLQYLRRNNRGELIFRGNNPAQPSKVIDILSPAKVQQGTSIRIRYNGNVSPGSCSMMGASNLPSLPATEGEGSFIGRGKASGSVFGQGREVNASLEYNKANFSLILSVSLGTRAQVVYQGKILHWDRSNSNNPNTLVLRGLIQSFASSANNLTAIETRGVCRIEVFDGRITSTLCNVSNIQNGNTQFTGMRQF
jgi:hypothetical protein